jgi:hypothetical protein
MTNDLREHSTFLCATILLICTMMLTPALAQNSSTNPGTPPAPCPTPSANTPGANGSPTAAPAAPAAKSNIPAGARALSFDLHIESGWVFELPGPVAFVETSTGAASSGGRHFHIAPSAGATFWITRWAGVYGDFIAIDLGTARASFDGLSTSATESLSGGFFGAQFQYPKGSLRPYIDLGGGVLRDAASGTSTIGDFQGSATVGSIRFGGGLRTMVTRRWGAMLSVEGYRFKGNGSAVTFPRIGVGWFFQTKPSGTGR